jgi:membrane-associated phospholipid phosphatase
MRGMRSAFSVFLLALAVAPLAAQEEAAEPTIPFSAPLTTVEAKRFAGVLALGGVAYLADHPVRLALRAPAAAERGVLGGLSNVAYYYGQPGVAVLAAGMWGSGLVADRPTLAKSGLRGMEAIALSGAVTVLLKELTGRARPDVAPYAKDDWQVARAFRTGNDYQSMASGHATVAFAFATAVTQVVADEAPEYANLVGVTTFGMAGITAWQRMYDDRHWLSDVTVGAGIGTVTALAIHRWHRMRPTNGIDRVFLRPIIAPMQDGVRAGLSVEWR